MTEKKLHLKDGLQGLTSGLGTMRDKAVELEYQFPQVAEEQLVAAYRTSWLARKIVDVPAMDSFRAWRTWQATAEEIEKLEAEEKRLQLLQKLMKTYRLARLYGACYLYFDLGDDASEPLQLDRVKAGGLRFATVLTHRHLSIGEIEDDPMDSRFGRPRWYGVYGKPGVRIHPSRVVTLKGSEPDVDMVFRGGGRTVDGESTLLPLVDCVKQFDSAAGNIASLIFEAKVDVIKVKGLLSYISGNPAEEQRLLDRYALAARAKGNNGMLLLDGDSEEYDQKNTSFAALPDIMDRFAQNASGAADIPMTRLYGRSPGGLSSTGDSDLRNYYDRISANQHLEIQPAMHYLDECLIRSALGRRPEEVHYLWSPLWQIDANERASIGNTTAGMIKTIQETGLIPDEVLARGAINALTEDGVLPGLEEEYTKYFEEGGQWEVGNRQEDGPDSGGVMLGDDGSDQPRHPAGSPQGGQFAPKEGGGAGGGPDAEAAEAAVGPEVEKVLTKKYTKEKLDELMQADPKTLGQYEYHKVKQYKKALAADKQAAEAAATAAASTGTESSDDSQPVGDPLGAGASEPYQPSDKLVSELSQDLHNEENFGLYEENSQKLAKMLSKESLNPESWQAVQQAVTMGDMSDLDSNELKQAAEYAYGTGDIEALAMVYNEDSTAAILGMKEAGAPAEVVNSFTDKMEASFNETPAGADPQPAAPAPAQAPEAAVGATATPGGITEEEAKAAAAEKVGTAKYTPEVLEQLSQQDPKRLSQYEAHKVKQYQKAIEEAKAQAAADPTADPVLTGEKTPTQAALEKVATGKYTPEKLMELAETDPKTLGQYEKHKLKQFQKALNEEHAKLINAPSIDTPSAPKGPAAPEPSPSSQPAASGLDPDSLAAGMVFAEIGAKHYGMNPDTVKKLATGEWQPDPSKPWQAQAAEEAKAALGAGAAQELTAAPAPAAGATPPAGGQGAPAASTDPPSGASAYALDPNSPEALKAFADIGKANMGMQAETVQKLATGEWQPDPNKHWQTTAAQQAKDVVSGVAAQKAAEKQAELAALAPKLNEPAVQEGLQKVSEKYGIPVSELQEYAVGAKKGDNYSASGIAALEAKTVLKLGKPIPEPPEPTAKVRQALSDTPPPTTPSSGAGHGQLNYADRPNHKDMTSEQREAISSYTGGGYSSINQALREGTSVPHSATQLDQVIAQSYAKEDMVVTRGFKYGGYLALTNGDPKIGGVIEDKGFVSTTRQHSTAQDFAGQYGYAMKIRVPKGSNIMPVNSISSVKGEDEFILPRGSKFKISEISGRVMVVDLVT